MTTSSSAIKISAMALWLAAAPFSARTAQAQTAPNGDNGDGDSATPTVVAAPRETTINIDGRLDEAAWASAVPATDFVQGEPVENAPAEQPTEVRVLYDEGAIYVGAFMYDPRPSTIAMAWA